MKREWESLDCCISWIIQRACLNCVSKSLMDLAQLPQYLDRASPTRVH